MDYQKIYNQIIERAKTRQLEGYKEKHHILPKCIGGLDVKENLVELTAREHFLCHKLLCKIYPNEYKLWYALWLMVIGKQKNKLNIFKIFIYLIILINSFLLLNIQISELYLLYFTDLCFNKFIFSFL